MSDYTVPRATHSHLSPRNSLETNPQESRLPRSIKVTDDSQPPSPGSTLKIPDRLFGVKSRDDKSDAHDRRAFPFSAGQKQYGHLFFSGAKEVLFPRRRQRQPPFFIQGRMQGHAGHGAENPRQLEGTGFSGAGL